MTVAEVKSILKIADGTNDEAIELLIPLTEDFLRRKCKDEFVEGFPPGLRLAEVTIIRHFLKEKGVSSETIGEYSVQYFGNLPSTVEAMIKPYRKTRFV